MKTTKDLEKTPENKRKDLKYFTTRDIPHKEYPVRQEDRKGSKIVVTTRSLAKAQRDLADKRERDRRDTAKRQKDEFKKAQAILKAKSTAGKISPSGPKQVKKT